MPLIATVGHNDTGHDGYHPRPIITGQSGYTIKGQDIATIGSQLTTHTRPGSPPHPGVVVEGAYRYTIRGIPISRIGDAVSCGGTIAEGVENYDIVAPTVTG